MIYAVALVCIKCLSSVGAWGVNRGLYLGAESLSTLEMLAICLLLVVLTALVYVVPSRKIPFQVRSIAGFAVVLAGLQILALGSDLAFGNFFDLVTVSCESFAHLLMWMAFIECVGASPVSPFRLTGLRSILYVVTASLLSMALDAGIASSTVVMVAIYALFLLLVLTLVAGNSAKTAPSESVESVANDIVQQLDDFANQHGLSGKEREIMELLVTGAKRSDIEKQLGLSEGTVRTHISRMYRKLDVHSKGELVELFEASH